MERLTASTLSILVVEDDEAAADLIREVLNDVVGWGATVVHDAAAARAIFQHVKIEVLVLDVNLPGISGIELLGLLRQDPHWNEPPIILMSANAGSAGRHGCRPRGRRDDLHQKAVRRRPARRGDPGRRLRHREHVQHVPVAGLLTVAVWDRARTAGPAR